MEILRERSGTSKQGTTMLGLYQASQQLGFKSTGYEGDLESLKHFGSPSILHVIVEERLRHYVVCYGYENGKFLIGDPGRGILELPEIELGVIWKSKSLLGLMPTDNLVQIKHVDQEKWNWFKDLIRDDAGLLGIIFGLSILIAILGMVMAVFSQKLIDNILPFKNVEKLILSLILITVLLIARAWISYLTGLFGVRQGRDFNNRLIAKFFDSLVFLPKSFYDNRRIGELVERMNDTSRIQTAIAGLAGELLKNLLLVVIGEIVLILYSPILGAISLILLPIFVAISWHYHTPIIQAQREVMVTNAHKSSNYVDSMHGINTIKGAHKENEFSKLNQVIYGHFQNKMFTLGRVGISLQFIAEIASVLMSIVIISVGSWLILAEKLTIGELIAILGISSGLFPAIVSLSFANITLQGAKIAFDRMYEFSAMKPEFVMKSDENSTLMPIFLSIEARNLSFRFPGRKLLLSEVSFELKRGLMIALIGESGSGKTTLLNILQRFYEPEQGEILLNGIPVSQFYIPHWREHIGVVPQEINLFNGSLLYNICLSTSADEMQKCLDFCIATGLHNYFVYFPQNYATLLGEEGVNISGGQRQLVGLARALWKDQPFLILDEPTSAMDRKMELFVLNLINKLKPTKCIILVTHRIKIARHSDRIYILENGKIQSSGDHNELMRTENLYSTSFRELVAL